MKAFLREMRRREVFRTLGLYVGVAWIIIEVTSVLGPTFDAPDWVMRWLVIVAMVGFPVAGVLAWVFDATEHGVVVQADADDDASVPPFGGRKTDFVVIGVLSVALMISVYLNIRSSAGPKAPIAPITVLIADFNNTTNNPLFDGSLEQALAIGIEGAPFINTYRRDQALESAGEFELGTALDAETARLVSVREDINLVLAGTIVADGNRLQLDLLALDPVTGESRATARARANSAAEVLAAVTELSADIRKELGDDAQNVASLRASETLTASSLEAIKAYTTAQALARDGQDEQAIVHYQEAVDLDPQFARAWSGWGLSAFKLGRSSEADELWKKALALADRMTERERYRTFGLYYTAVSLNYDKAIENYQQLVEKFPADGAGNNNLAILYIFTAQYDRALQQSEALLKIYPGRTLYKANHAQYALYAGEIDTAVEFATAVLDDDPEFFKSHMILALAALVRGDVEAAKAEYAAMAELGTRGASLATIGLADIAIYEHRYNDAQELLLAGIERDRAGNDERGVATKSIALAQSRLASEDNAGALAILESLDVSRWDGQMVPAAEIFAYEGRVEEAAEIAAVYKAQLRPTAGAYARLVDGLIAYNLGQYTEAIGKYREALEMADLWLIRYHLAQAYLAADYPVEASAEFTSCIERKSEAGGMFFDDIPTWRYTARLEDWKAAASRHLTGAN